MRLINPFLYIIKMFRGVLIYVFIINTTEYKKAKK